MKRYTAFILTLLLTVTVTFAQQAFPPRTQKLQDAQSTGNGVELNTTGYSVVTLEIVGSEAGTDRVVTFEAWQDITAGFVAVQCANQGTRVVSTTLTTSGVTAYHVQCDVAGFNRFRTPLSGGATGNVTVTATAISNSSAGIVAAVMTPAAGAAPTDVNVEQWNNTTVAVPFDLDTGAGTQNIVGFSMRKAASGGSVEYGTGTDPFNVTGPLTDTQLRATAVPVSGPLTDTQLRATAVPVSGPLTDTQLRATAVPVSGTVTANAGTGTFNNQQSNITEDYDTGAGTQTMTKFGIALPASGGSVAGGTSTNPFRTDPTGTTTQPVSGTVTANAGTNLNTSALALEATLASIKDTAGVKKITDPLPAGTNIIGALTANQSVNVNQWVSAALSAPIGEADAVTNPGSVPMIASFLSGYNGTTWDRLRTAAGPNGVGVLRTVAVNNDPCQTSGTAKSSVVVNVTADAQLVALSGSTTIYVCQLSVTVAGTTPTFRLISGTGAVCATGLTGRTGAYAPLTGTYMQVGGGDSTLLASAAGEALCMDTEGTSPSVQGVLTYVQQ